MTAKEIVAELKTMGSATTKKTWMTHGAREPFFGVKVGDMKKIQKRVKKDYQLAIDLYATGISDAMYLAGLIADDAAMTEADLQRWVAGAYWYMISEYTVPWVAAGSRYGHVLALKWIDRPEPLVAAAGWSTFSSLVSTKPDSELDMPELKKLLGRVQKTIHTQPNRVRYTMNGFVIAVGSYVAPLTDAAVAAGEKIGQVAVNMPGTECKVPLAAAYIEMVRDRGTIGKKRKTAKC